MWPRTKPKRIDARHGHDDLPADRRIAEAPRPGSSTLPRRAVRTAPPPGIICRAPERFRWSMGKLRAAASRRRLAALCISRRRARAARSTRSRRGRFPTPRAFSRRSAQNLAQRRAPARAVHLHREVHRAAAWTARAASRRPRPRPSRSIPRSSPARSTAGWSRATACRSRRRSSPSRTASRRRSPKAEAPPRGGRAEDRREGGDAQGAAVIDEIFRNGRHRDRGPRDHRRAAHDRRALRAAPRLQAGHGRGQDPPEAGGPRLDRRGGPAARAPRGEAARQPGRRSRELARLQKGATAYFQRRKVNDEIWLPSEARFTRRGEGPSLLRRPDRRLVPVRRLQEVLRLHGIDDRSRADAPNSLTA